MLPSQRFAAAFTEQTQTPKTLVESAYMQLRRDIIEGRLPAGEKLRVEHLKDHYEVGAGTLREALSMLLSDALVVAESQRGYRVAPISLSDLEDLTRTRILIETESVRMSIRTGDDAWEAQLVAAYHRLSRADERLGVRANAKLREWEVRNCEFHEALIAGCDSPWMRYLLGLLYRQLERYRRLALSRQHGSRDVHAEHQEIYEAALARDDKRASAALEQHIRLTFESLRDLPYGDE